MGAETAPAQQKGAVESAVDGVIGFVSHPGRSIKDGLIKGARMIDGTDSPASIPSAPTESTALTPEQYQKKVQAIGMQKEDLALAGSAPDGTNFYEVAKSGSLKAIAAKVGQPLKELESFNPTLKGKSLKAGDLVLLGFKDTGPAPGQIAGAIVPDPQ